MGARPNCLQDSLQSEQDQGTWREPQSQHKKLLLSSASRALGLLDTC